jgi:hypothetical protein
VTIFMSGNKEHSSKINMIARYHWIFSPIFEKI